MKKFLLIGLIVSLALVLVGGVGMVFARGAATYSTNTVTITTNRNGNKIIQQYNGPGGMMDGYGYGPGGMMGGYGPGGMMDGFGYGPGGMIGGYGRGGMMGGRGLQGERYYGIMHDDIISAFASAVGLTVDEVNARLVKGETLTQIANAQGFTGDKLTQLVTQVHKSALDKAVSDGVITQAQADRMLQMMNNYSGMDFGIDTCPMWDNDQSQP